MTTRPVWLLDVDGVVNCITQHPNHSIWPENSWLYTEVEAAGQTWPISTSTHVIDYINNIHDEGLAEIRWHTTWQADANRLGHNIGLRNFPVAEAPEFHDRSFTARAIRDGTPAWWKFSAALRVLHEENRPLIWTDDDLERETRRYGWPFPIKPFLPIVPLQEDGLTRTHLRQISEFIEEVA